jgi:hypothetical protein
MEAMPAALHVYQEAQKELRNALASATVVNARPNKKAKYSVGDLAVGDFHHQHLVLGATTELEHPDLETLPRPSVAPADSPGFKIRDVQHAFSKDDINLVHTLEPTLQYAAPPTTLSVIWAEL